MNPADIRIGVEVVGSCGGHVGFVDGVEGEVTIRLRRRDEDAGGVHHYIPTDWVESAGQAVRLVHAAQRVEHLPLHLLRHAFGAGEV